MRLELGRALRGLSLRGVTYIPILAEESVVFGLMIKTCASV